MFKYVNNCFFAYALKSRYESAGTWPESGIDVDSNVHAKYSSTPPDGYVLGTDESGHPKWVIHQDSVSTEITARALRDSAISSSMWIAERHRGQVALGVETSIKPEQYTELLTYHQDLRDWPSQPGWPDIDMPPAPDWLAELKK